MLPVVSTISSASLSPYGHPRAAVPQYGHDITWRSDHEKAQYAWDRRWCRVIGCGALLASMVPRECGPCGATANVVTCECTVLWTPTSARSPGLSSSLQTCLRRTSLFLRRISQFLRRISQLPRTISLLDLRLASLDPHKLYRFCTGDQCCC